MRHGEKDEKLAFAPVYYRPGSPPGLICTCPSTLLELLATSKPPLSDKGADRTQKHIDI